jgi:hypothetical protein
MNGERRLANVGFAAIALGVASQRRCGYGAQVSLLDEEH